MNFSELARRLHISTHELRELFPLIGFDIGLRAIKVDAKVAKKIIANWTEYKRVWDDHVRAKREEEEKLRKEEKKSRTSPVTLPAIITVKAFAENIQVPLTRVMGELMKNGILASLNERIDFDTASIIAAEFGVEVIADKRTDSREEEVTTQEKLSTLLKGSDEKTTQNRPPVVVIMGHVDHGKTKLLDTIRESDVVAGEAGGITQHIGAYQVTKNEQKITFIDTPGHEAFTSMRSRGARIADIAVLVVAADDGVKPQTEEAIRIIRQAGVPFVVAINKIDKTGAHIEKTKTELAQFDILAEDWGGKIPMIPLSALKGEGIDKLLEMILFITEVERENIQANSERQAIATVIEAHVDKGEGPVATLLVQAGTLQQGDYLNADGATLGKVRVLRTDRGVAVITAGPSTPVQVLGFKQAATVGDIIEASKKSLTKVGKVRSSSAEAAQALTVSPQAAQEEDDEQKKLLPIVVKADVLGSLEAIIAQVEKMEHSEVGIKILTKGLGNITENDLTQAHAAGEDALIIGFHVTAASDITARAQDLGVTIEYYSVIYELTKKLTEALERLLAPATERTVISKARVLAHFYEKGKEQVVGCRIEEGKALPKTFATIMRDGKDIGSVHITQIRTGKQVVKEAAQGSEYGIALEGKVTIKEGDILEIYTEKTQERTLEFTQNS